MHTLYYISIAILSLILILFLIKNFKYIILKERCKGGTSGIIIGYVDRKAWVKGKKRTLHYPIVEYISNNDVVTAVSFNSMEPYKEGNDVQIAYNELNNSEVLVKNKAYNNDIELTIVIGLALAIISLLLIIQ